MGSNLSTRHCTDIFSHICCKNCNICLKIWKNKRGRDLAHFKKYQKKLRENGMKGFVRWSYFFRQAKFFRFARPLFNYFKQLLWQVNVKNIHKVYSGYQTHDQCDQIGRFIALWTTIQSLWQLSICPNLLHSSAIFVKVSKSVIFLVKPGLPP